MLYLKSQQPFLCQFFFWKAWNRKEMAIFPPPPLSFFCFSSMTVGRESFYWSLWLLMFQCWILASTSCRNSRFLNFFSLTLAPKLHFFLQPQWLIRQCSFDLVLFPKFGNAAIFILKEKSTAEIRTRWQIIWSSTTKLRPLGSCT